MSRSYEVTLYIKSVPDDKVHKVHQACQAVWGFQEFDMSPSTVVKDAQDMEGKHVNSLGGGRTEKELARELARKIWRAAGRYVEVLVTTVYLDDLPTECYEMGYDEYVKHGAWPGDSEE